ALSPDACVASLRAASMPPGTKSKVVPPSIASGSRSSCVRTKVGAWYGGLSPRQPFHESSSQGPRTGPKHVATEDQGTRVLQFFPCELIVGIDNSSFLPVHRAE